MDPIIGTEIVNGMRLGHTFFEVNVIKDLLLQYKPKHFVEIGVHEGVLSKLIIEWRELLLPELNYTGIEFDCNIVRTKDYYTLPNTLLLCADAFAQPTVDFVRSLVGKKIVYCDNGHKAREIRVYAPTVQPGDILMTHDFSDGTRYGMGLPDKIGVEVTPEDIEFLEADDTFVRLVDPMFTHTRIVAFLKK